MANRKSIPYAFPKRVNVDWLCYTLCWCLDNIGMDMAYITVNVLDRRWILWNKSSFLWTNQHCRPLECTQHRLCGFGYSTLHSVAVIVSMIAWTVTKLLIYGRGSSCEKRMPSMRPEDAGLNTQINHMYRLWFWTKVCLRHICDWIFVLINAAMNIKLNMEMRNA